jgi:hypothetical protein
MKVTKLFLVLGGVMALCVAGDAVAEVDLSAEQISRLDEHFSHRDYHTVYLGATGTKATAQYSSSLYAVVDPGIRVGAKGFAEQSIGSLQHMASDQKLLGNSSGHVAEAQRLSRKLKP